MGRSMRYSVGSVINGYTIAAREADTRYAWIRCQHTGCQQMYKVAMSNVLQSSARRFCSVHQAEMRERRKMETIAKRRIEQNIQRSIEVADMQARNRPEPVEVVGRVAPELSPMREMLDVVALRTARDRAGLPWVGHVNDGKCFGWFIVDRREQTMGGAVRWKAFCAVCGVGRGMYDAQLKRKGLNRCRNCMALKERYEIAKRAFEKALDKGLDMTNPSVLLRVAAWLGTRFDDGACIGWTRNAVVTFDELLRLESARLQVEEPEPMPVAKEQQIDWIDQPLEDWPYDELVARAQDMLRNGEKYLWMGPAILTRPYELIAEVKRRDAASKEEGNESVDE